MAGPYDPAASWAVNLNRGGYEHHCRNTADLDRIRRLGYAWRRILRIVGSAAPASAFEIGCGGGAQMAVLALNGFAASGIDVSADVLGRARRYFSEIESMAGRPLPVDLMHGDFLAFETDRRFDLVYHFGVVEHYLDPARRAEFWARAVRLARPGAWIVSVVPCGRHVMRGRVRAGELCGFSHEIEEIDYSCAAHIEEFERAGLTDIKALPHNYFFFLGHHPDRLVRKIAFPLCFALGNAALPWLPLPVSVKERFAQTLIVAGRKPG